MNIGDKVKVIELTTNQTPSFNEAYLGEIGVVANINDIFQFPVLLSFENNAFDNFMAFKREELETV